MQKQIALSQRKSGIELLKIIAMFLIVIHHCVYTIRNSENFILNNININRPTTNISIFIAQFFSYFGGLGNAVFLISSAWFLVDSNSTKLNKIAQMLLNVYVISVIILSIFFLGKVVILSVEDILKSLFPTTFQNNWYITCYLLLYAIYPLLNIVINKLTQKQHLVYCSVFFILYLCLGSIDIDFLYGNSFIHFVGIYFIIAYLKKYNSKLISTSRTNIIFLAVGMSLLILLLLAMNIAGFHINIVAKKMLQFTGMHNPIILLTAFSMFNIFRNLKIQNKVVNYISSLTIFIYIIHDNVIFRKYLRPNLLFCFWETSSRMNIVLFALICSLILFTASTLFAILYNKILQPTIEKIADKMLELFLKLYSKFEGFVLKVK